MEGKNTKGMESENTRGMESRITIVVESESTCLLEGSPIEFKKQIQQGEINGKEDYVSKDLYFKKARVRKIGNCFPAYPEYQNCQ